MSNRSRPQTRPATALASASHEDDTINETTGGRRRAADGHVQSARAPLPKPRRHIGVRG
jgi:hypothetical protein